MRDEQQSVHLQQLTAKLRDRTAVIGIIGLGYRVLKCAFRSTVGSSAAVSGGRGSKGTLRIGGLCATWVNGRWWSAGLVMVVSGAHGRLVTPTAEVSAPGNSRLRWRFQFASGEAAT